MENWGRFRVHEVYYIRRQLNSALKRCLDLPNAECNIDHWFSACPKPRLGRYFWPVPKTKGKQTR